MATPVELFDYDLPPELIAQHSVEPRDQARLMVVDRGTGQSQHKRFYEVVDELWPGDVLVMNDTKVFRARLRGTANGREVEVFLLRPRGEYEWEALLKPGRRVKVGDTITVGEIHLDVLAKNEVAHLRSDRTLNVLLEFANAHGEIPVPPYVHEAPAKLEDYQTVYAREVGSVAAPTAGFHFTKELLEKIRSKGVRVEFVTLHVGLGTFRPIKSETIEGHKMHSEFVTITPSTAQAINEAKRAGRRVVAVGTTTVRTLEGVARTSPLTKGRSTLSSRSKRGLRGVLSEQGFTGDVNLFITPGFDFRVVDALITNFHLPKSTLLVLVSAFMSRERALACYHEAIRERYRFFSFGDAMFMR